MKKPVIAVDIDDVLSVYGDALIRFSNKRWGTSLTVEDIHEDWARMWQINHEPLAERADTLHAELFKDLKHNESAKPVLEKLSLKYKLVITTSRQKKLLKDTEDWLNQYFNGIFSELHFAGIFDGEYSEDRYKLTKKEIVSRIGADYLIDDQPKHCLAVAEAGIKGLLFGEYPWNKVSRLPEDVTRVRDWKEVEDYFERIKD